MALQRKTLRQKSRASRRSKRTISEMDAYISKPAKKYRKQKLLSDPAIDRMILEGIPPLKSSEKAGSNTGLSCNGKAHSGEYVSWSSDSTPNVYGGKVDSKDLQLRCPEPVCFKLCHKELTSYEIAQVKTFLKHPPGGESKELQLRNCNVSDDTLTKFINVSGATKVNFLDISGNKNLNPTTVAKLIKNVRPERVVLKECSLKVNQELRSALFGNDTTVKSLDISHHGLEASSDEREVRLALMSPIKELILADCGLTSKFFKLLAKSVTNVNTDVLDLSCNHLDAEAMEYLARIVSNAYELKKLNLSDCQLDLDGIKIFASIVEARVYEIDLSDNCLSTDRSLEEVAQIVSRLRPEWLALNNCDIENVTKLQESRKSKRIALQRLELSENIRISTKDIGLLATAWQIQDLVLLNCQFTVEDVKNLCLELRYKQLTHLDVSDLSEIPNEAKNKAIDTLRQVVKNANVTYQCADISE